ncbi:MAG: chalcone isomerase family protein [Acidobacteriota bacterium]
MQISPTRNHRWSTAATLALLALVLVLVPATPAFAGKLAGVTLPDSVEVGDQEMVLNGMALRSKLFIKVYVAGLYLPAKTASPTAVLSADEPRRLDMNFLRSVGADSICGAWSDGLAANTPNASAELKGQFETLCSWMEDVDKGESFSFTYLPGTGTTVEVKGQNKGTLAGKAFADALFACWIGLEPGPGEGFRDDLMGG